MSAGITAYVAFYETLSPQSLANMETVVAPDVHFRDPFNDVRGLDAYRRILTKMFEDVPDIKFTVGYHAVADNTGILRWRCTGTVKIMGNKPWIVEGMSELRFAPDGRVREHIDYWDAAGQFYERLPVIGGILRLIRRRVAG